MATYNFPGTPAYAGSDGTHNGISGARVDIKQTPNPSANNSTIQWWFYIWDALGSSHWEYNYNNKISVKINNVAEYTYNGNSSSARTVKLTGTSAANPLLLASGTTTVAHDANGTKNLDVYASYYNSSANATNLPAPGLVVDYSGANAIELHPTKENASISSCPDLTLDGFNDHTVSWSSLTGMYYKVQWKVGSTVVHTSSAVAGNGSTVSATWADVPISLASYADPDATSLTATAVLTTYSDSACTNVVGTDSDTFTVTYDTSEMIPTINSITLTHADQLSGVYVSGKSSTSVAWTATTKGDATIASSYAVYIDENGTEIGSRQSGSSPVSLGILPAFTETSKNIRVRVSITDSRGLTVTKDSAPFLAYGYSVPTISVFSVERCGPTGEKDGSGEYFMCYLVYNIRSLEAKNGKHVGISYFFSSQRSSPAQWVTPSVPDPSSYSGTISIGPYPIPTGSDEPVIVIATVWDYYTASDKASAEATIKGNAVFVDILTDSLGKKVALGIGAVVMEEGKLRVGYEIDAEDAIKLVDSSGNVRCVIDFTNGIRFYDDEGTLTKTYSVS